MVTIYCGNLPFVTDEAELRSWFEGFGAVAKATIVTDRQSARSRGFGFVEIPDGAAAQAAIAGLDGKEFHGRQIVVKVAEPKTRGRG